MSGCVELVYLPREIFNLAEKARNKLGMSRSAFYRYCVMTYLESKSLVLTHLKEAISNDEQ